MRWHLLAVAFFAMCSASARAIDLPYKLDLSRPFNTRSDWRLVITQDSKSELRDRNGEVVGDLAGAIHLCFQKAFNVDCPPMGVVNRSGMAFNDIARVAIVHDGSAPLLLVRTTGAVINIGFSNFETTWVWAYKPASDRFSVIFSNATGATNNQETRFLEGGPLAGDIVVALNPPLGSSAPYPYSITVYHRAETGDFRQILRYTARSRENDGNPLAVIDAEMPAIEYRLHVWRTGQPLPEPKYRPPSCAALELRHGIEWCR
jgi:hypothetical protein